MRANARVGVGDHGWMFGLRMRDPAKLLDYVITAVLSVFLLPMMNRIIKVMERRCPTLLETMRELEYGRGSILGGTNAASSSLMISRDLHNASHVDFRDQSDSFGDQCSRTYKAAQNRIARSVAPEIFKFVNPGRQMMEYGSVFCTVCMTAMEYLLNKDTTAVRLFESLWQCRYANEEGNSWWVCLGQWLAIAVSNCLPQTIGECPQSWRMDRNSILPGSLGPVGSWNWSMAASRRSPQFLDAIHSRSIPVRGSRNDTYYRPPKEAIT